MSREQRDCDLTKHTGLYSRIRDTPGPAAHVSSGVDRYGKKTVICAKFGTAKDPRLTW